MMIISYYVIVAHKAPDQYVVLLPQGYAICCITLTLQRIFSHSSHPNRSDLVVLLHVVLT